MVISDWYFVSKKLFFFKFFQSHNTWLPRTTLLVFAPIHNNIQFHISALLSFLAISKWNVNIPVLDSTLLSGDPVQVHQSRPKWVTSLPSFSETSPKEYCKLAYYPPISPSLPIHHLLKKENHAQKSEVTLVDIFYPSTLFMYLSVTLQGHIFTCILPY